MKDPNRPSYKTKDPDYLRKYYNLVLKPKLEARTIKAKQLYEPSKHCITPLAHVSLLQPL